MCTIAIYYGSRAVDDAGLGVLGGFLRSFLGGRIGLVVAPEVGLVCRLSNHVCSGDEAIAVAVTPPSQLSSNHNVTLLWGREKRERLTIYFC